MGKGRKGKKQSVREDLGSGEEEKIQVRRRGRPQKASKDDEEEQAVKVEDEENDSENTKGTVFIKDVKNQSAVNGKKRKRTSQVKEVVDSVKVENGVGTKTNSNDLIKSVGFRQNGSRRKNKPRRAAEVGVECR
ncbi:uncharacterized protein LOC132607385 [Lycium barbarum]|uniref:uncharacterized protein LOC132607385 n=1 Tax=Lycium barbarum TaxID=112863 RepID=UPI00293F6422|nr:uncharacterized protein LOC132607385 [Lycium barbarum]XP_060177309.1 uncharacterized protein LOC132607385 [Lycium barbarum]XP_060177310.1 uncharacterized protein LOC132607385 [Lycium barbarum]